MNILLVALISAFVALLGYFVFRRFSPYQLTRTHIVDAKAQEAYQHNKHHADEEKTLTLKEKLALSWQFLKTIKEQVMNKFSQDDQRKLEEAGNILLGYGMKYKHDVALEIKQQVAPSQTIAKEKNKDKGQSASL